MKPPLWKRAISHVIEVPLGRYESEYSPELKLSLYKGRYMLSVNNVIYSFEDKYTSFQKAFELVKPEIRDINKVLVLGYGLGSISTILHKLHGITPEITAVDIDPVVLDLAATYNSLPNAMEVKYIKADATEYLNGDSRKYDLICIDVFIDDQVPAAFKSEAFLDLVEQHLTDNGMMLFNWLFASSIQKRDTDQYFYHVFVKRFPLGRFLSTGGNLVLIYDKSRKNRH